MSGALILSLALVAGLAIGGLEWALRIERRAARRAHDAGRTGWTVTPTPDPGAVYDWAAWEHEVSDERGSTSLAAVLVPALLFAAGLVIVGWYAR